MKFIHTSDLQIGKGFSFFDTEIEALLKNARYSAIKRIAEQAIKLGATDVIVAGDVYDKQQLSPITLAKPIEIMRQQPNITWHLMPGNHDAHRENGLWARLIASGLPDNVRLHLEPKPVEITSAGELACLLPAPLRYISSANDLTEYMDGAATPEGAIRIGIAHGSIRGFGSEGEASNLISPDRAATAGLSYLALGDWHRQQKVNEHTWYSGTPEPDRFKRDPNGTSSRCNGGYALLVSIDEPRALPVVTPIETGHFHWHQVERVLGEDSEVGTFEADLRALTADPSRLIVDITVSGALSLAGHGLFEERIAGSFRAAVAGLRLDIDHLLSTPTESDLDEIDRAGFVRIAADRLRIIAQDPSDPARASLATSALSRLFVEHVRTRGAA